MKYEFTKDEVIVNGETYDKEEIFNHIAKESFTSKKIEIDKGTYEDGLYYEITTDTERMKVLFPTKYRKNNKEYIHYLNEKNENESDKNTKKILCQAGLIIFLTGAITALGKFKLIETGKCFDTIRLDAEIDIHSNNHFFSPNLWHACPFDEINEKPIDKCIINYCEENGFGEEYIEKALEKNEKAENNKEYKKINLHKFY